MSQEIGDRLPPPLQFELGAVPQADIVPAALLVSHDDDGMPRVAVVSTKEITVRDPSHLQLRLHASSNAAANLLRNGSGALWCVLDAAAYCIRAHAAASRDATGDDSALFDLTIVSVLRDFQPDAPLVHGPVYRRAR